VGEEFRFRERAAVKIALDDVAAVAAELVGLSGCFDAFSDDGEVEGLSDG